MNQSNIFIINPKNKVVDDVVMFEYLVSRGQAYTKEMKEGVQKKDAKLQEVGYKNYTK